MHGLAYFTALYDQRGLNAFADGYQIVMNGRHGKE